jgi:membrane protein YqaA with SNARE-associated domain
MEIIERYKLLFEDSFFNSLFCVFKKKYVFDAMDLLGIRTDTDYAIYLIAMLAAFQFNFILGRLFAEYCTALHNYANYIRFCTLYNKYGFILSLFGFLDLWGALICVIAGLTNSRYVYFFALSLLGLLLKTFIHSL